MINWQKVHDLVLHVYRLETILVALLFMKGSGWVRDFKLNQSALMIKHFQMGRGMTGHAHKHAH